MTVENSKTYFCILWISPKKSYQGHTSIRKHANTSRTIETKIFWLADASVLLQSSSDNLEQDVYRHGVVFLMVNVRIQPIGPQELTVCIIGSADEINPIPFIESSCVK